MEMPSLINQIKLIRTIGVWGYTKYRLAPDGNSVQLKVAGRKVTVRKGSPDLTVAITCLVESEFNFVSHLLDRNFSGYIIDAGGYIGTAAIAFTSMFPRATIISVEPSLSNLVLLKENTRSFPHIRVIHGALVGGAANSVFLYDRSTGEWGYSTVAPLNASPSAEVLHEVPAYTLSDLCEDCSEVGVLKIDIEGGELDLFQNDAESVTLAQIIVVELHDRIIEGCTDAFKKVSSHRRIIKMDGEKYISVIDVAKEASSIAPVVKCPVI